MTKACTMCGEVKTLDLFYNKAGGKLGKTARCKICTDIKNKEHANSEAARQAKKAWDERNHLRKRSYYTLNKFGLDYTEYKDEVEKRLSSQGGVCVICQESPYRGKRGPVLDHCHTSNEIRGVLCWTCNAAIGHLKDNTVSLKRAIDYLSAESAVLA